jgi:hypothetical protein
MPRRARLCLKARPTPNQLADRLRPVDDAWPDGLELYLAAADLESPAMMDQIVERIQSADVPDGFAWLIEGPVDSLDGCDFDVSRESDADTQVIERLADLARRIGARAVNIHVISPSPDLSRLTLECRAALLDRAVPFLRRFVDLIESSGAVATVENMPPVLRMRRSDFAFTPIGMASEDLRWLVDTIPGLRLLPDTSHAGLYLNARRLAPDPAHDWSGPLTSYLAQLPPEPEDLTSFVEQLPNVENAQVSNAAGVLGEGLAYDEGDYTLDPTIRWLGVHARHIVAETIETSNDDAVLMRDALRRMRMVVC